MRTLAVIPARLGATRLPRKPLRLLAGVPLVVRVWQRVVELGVADRVVVATDAAEVVEVVEQHGGHALLTAAHHVSGTHRVAEVALTREYADYDVVVNVQGDEPFVSRQALLGAMRMVTEARFPLGTAAVRATPEILADPNVVKVVAADDGRAMYFSRAPIPFLRDPSDAELQRSRIWQHIGVYAYEFSALMQWTLWPEGALEQIERLEQLRPLAAGMPIGVSLIGEAVRPGIDTEDDLERANRDWTAYTTG
jgi:3-deoxy-manno-octulosonate cytidylyltransferase (CMP-KDO synthetase)